MNKVYNILLGVTIFSICSWCRIGFAQTFNSSANQPAIGVAVNDHFTYLGNNVPFYNMGWYNESVEWPPLAYLSSYSGIKLFTQGAVRAFVDLNGNVGVNTVTPREKLDVMGGRIAVTGSDQNGTVLISAEGGNSYFGTNSINNGFSVDHLGRMGIATGNPRAGLDMSKYVSSGSLGMVLSRMPEGDGNGDGTFLGVRGYETQVSGYQGKTFSLEHGFYGQTNSSINFFRGGSQTGGFMTFNTNANIERMRIDPWGNIGIATINMPERLTVNGKIKANEIRVDGNGAPDYVFDSGYERLSLIEIDRFVKLHRHLPEIPSAAEVAANGLELGEMNRLLLKKIEELTLHLIEMDERVRFLEKARSELKK